MKYKVNWEKMSKAEKKDYIWDYYRYHIIIGVLVIFCLISVVINRLTYKEPLLNVLMLNYAGEEDVSLSGFTSFLENYGYENFDEAVTCNTSLYFLDNAGTEYQDYQTKEALYAWISAGEYDVFFGTGDLFLQIVDEGVLINLTEFLSEDLLAKYEGNLIYSDEDDTVEPYPCALQLKENGWLNEYQYYDECYFGIIYNGPSTETAKEFAEYILE